MMGMLHRGRRGSRRGICDGGIHGEGYKWNNTSAVGRGVLVITMGCVPRTTIHTSKYFVLNESIGAESNTASTGYIALCTASVEGG